MALKTKTLCMPAVIFVVTNKRLFECIFVSGLAIAFNICANM